MKTAEQREENRQLLADEFINGGHVQTCGMYFHQDTKHGIKQECAVGVAYMVMAREYDLTPEMRWGMSFTLADFIEFYGIDPQNLIALNEVLTVGGVVKRHSFAVIGDMLKNGEVRKESEGWIRDMWVDHSGYSQLSAIDQALEYEK